MSDFSAQDRAGSNTPPLAITAYIGLGSNLDNPRAHIERALTELNQLPLTTLQSQSPLYQSAAVGPGDQPDYINAVAELSTQLAPLELLDQLQRIELEHNRVRLEHWGPRTLDLDVLLYGNEVIYHPRLQAPHAFLTQRNFVVYPLAATAPNLVLPCGTPIALIQQNIPPDDLRVIR